MKYYLWLFIFFFTAFQSVGFAQSVSSSEETAILKYYPLKVGNVLKYRIGVNDVGHPERWDEVVSYDPTLNAFTIRSIGKAFDEAPIITERIVEIRHGRVLQLTKLDRNYGMTISPKPDVIFSTPLSIGTSWENKSIIDKTEMGKTTCRIVGFENKVVVQAGTFNNVCVVEVKSYYRRWRIKQKEPYLMGVDHVYYAPNIGKIKTLMVGGVSFNQDERTGEFKNARPYHLYREPKLLEELIEYTIN